MTPVEALQKSLAGEHAAVYLYGVIAAQASRFDSGLTSRLTSAYLQHRRQRDRLNTLISRHGAEPVAAATSYRLPNAAASSEQITTIARDVERRLELLYGQLVESVSGADRALAITALTDAAERGLDFGARPQHFPGMSNT